MKKLLTFSDMTKDVRNAYFLFSQVQNQVQNHCAMMYQIINNITDTQYSRFIYLFSHKNNIFLDEKS